MTGGLARTGRLGLALSGGGFRAAFFHIGVLARMSTLGLLRRVEVLSTVSGGSIVGAMYYLHVKRLLETTPDADVTDADYQRIVERVERDFLLAVQKSVLVNTFSAATKNWKMLWPGYTRSNRVGELFDELFFRPAWQSPRSAPIEMRELKIIPPGHSGDFSPLHMNAARRTPVPILYLNATTLNTGRDWGFTASRMGERPSNDSVSNEIDKKTRLRRPPSYEQLPEPQRRFPLGLAVAASAGVPGALPPLPIAGLYGGATVQLVDGGAVDNQGIGALTLYGCDRMIISDASGQLEFIARPETSAIATIERTNSILMDRVRELELRSRLQGDTRSVALLHLRKGLDAEALACTDRAGGKAGPAEPKKRERQSAVSSEQFGVSREVQERLSRIRTALDAFSEVEALSLMLDAYLMSGHELRETPAIAELVTDVPDVAEERWRFSSMRPWMAHPTEDYLEQLSVAGESLFRYWRLARTGRHVALGSAVVLLVVSGVALAPHLESILTSRVSLWQMLVAVVATGLLFGSAARDASGRVQFIGYAARVMRGVTVHPIVSALGALASRLHLSTVNRWVLRMGEPARLKKPLPRATAGADAQAAFGAKEAAAGGETED